VKQKQKEHQKTRRFINDCTEKETHHLSFFTFSAQNPHSSKADNRPAPSNGMGQISLFSTVFLFPFQISFLSTEIVPQGQSPANKAERD
jgi:hypothetical protein